MGSEDEVEQSNGRPSHETNGRSKATCDNLNIGLAELLWAVS